MTLPEYAPGSSAATICLPSGPIHRPTLKGIPTAEPHVSFCVENPLIPQWARIDGSDAGNPKQSGSMNSWLTTPNSRWK